MPEQETDMLEKRVEAENADSMDADSYIEALKEIKENSVSKDDYLKLKAENRKLLNSLANGDFIEQPKVEEVVDVNELRNSLFNRDNTNLEFAEKSLKLRDELMKRGDPDPFIPMGKQINPTREDVECAQRVADALASCIEYAQGDSQVFTNELQRITVDTSPNLRRKK